MTKKKRVIQGGTSAGKTYAIIPILIDFAIKNPRKVITVVAESVPALRNGAVQIFFDVMHDTNRWIQDHWRSSPVMEYTFYNGSRISFQSFDSVGKAKAAGKRNVLFINEANHVNYDIADALMIRTTDMAYLDFNPDAEFWAHTEVLPEPNAEFLLLTYKDNEALPDSILEDLLIKQAKAKTSEYWANWCKVYIDGEIGSLQGTIIQNWRQGEFDTSLPFAYGMDFGFSNDPDTLLKVAVDKKRKIIYCDEQMYKVGNSTEQLTNMLKSIVTPGNSVIIADSADPRTINDLRTKGLNVIPAEKGRDSVRSGLKRIQDYEIIVTPNSINLIKELRNYVWHDKKSETPIDAYNHLIDPLRYSFGYLCPLSGLAIGGMKK